MLQVFTLMMKNDDDEIRQEAQDIDQARKENG